MLGGLCECLVERLKILIIFIVAPIFHAAHMGNLATQAKPTFGDEREVEKFGSPASRSSLHFPFFVAPQGVCPVRGCNEDRRIRNVDRAQGHRQQCKRLHKDEVFKSSCGHADCQPIYVARCK